MWGQQEERGGGRALNGLGGRGRFIREISQLKLTAAQQVLPAMDGYDVEEIKVPPPPRLGRIGGSILGRICGRICGPVRE